MLLLPVLSSCSSKDDEPEGVPSELQGVWECTSCNVLSIGGLNGLSVPDVVTDLIKGKIEEEMIGERITITSEAKLKGDILILPNSGISWKILSRTDKNMSVQYDSSSTEGGYGLNMSVKADYKKVK